MFLHLNNIQELLNASQEWPVILFKHSATCPISSNAKTEMEAFMQVSPVPVYMVVVQEQRPLSNEIASVLNVVHQSPQAIVVWKGAAADSVSHYSIKGEALKKLLEKCIPKT